MATTNRQQSKKAAAQQPKVATKPVQQVVIRPVFEPTDETPTYYANHFEVGQTSHEFFILSGRIQGKLSDAVRRGIDKDGTLVLEPELQIIVAPTLVQGLIHALTAQLERWNQAQTAKKTQGEGE